MGKGNTKKARRFNGVKTRKSPKKSVETEENKQHRRQKEINEAMYALGEKLKQNELNAAKKAANEAAFWRNWKARSAERRLELAPTIGKTSPIQALIENIVAAPVRVNRTNTLRKAQKAKKLNKTQRAQERKYGLEHLNVEAARQARYNALIAEGLPPNSAKRISDFYAWGLDPATRAMREGKVNWGAIVENEYPTESLVAVPRPVVTVVSIPSPVVEEEVVPTKFVTLKITNLPNLTDKMRDKFVFKMGTLKKQIHGKLGDRQHIFPKEEYPEDPIDKYDVEEDTDEVGNLRLTAYVTYNKHEYAERVLESHAVMPVTFKHFIKGEKQDIPVVIEPSGHKYKRPKASD